MRLGELDPQALGPRLREGLRCGIGPVVLRLRADAPELARQLHQLYSEYPLADEARFADVDLRVVSTHPPLRPWQRQVQLLADGMAAFAPFPADHALPMVEWGFNWHFAKRFNRFLMLHSGAVARDDRAILFPAWPGSGKSTLCAALAARGWRLLSDEFGLVRPDDDEIVPFPRLIPLKNESIGVIRAFAPDAVIGPTFPKTRKGDVAHFRPPRESVLAASRTATAAHIVFPAFARDAKLELLPIEKPAAFMKLAGNSFNYELLGADAFRCVSRLVRRCGCHILKFGDLESAIATLELLP
jgi:HprK-related kinase A